jgi:hypothetical protein
MLGRSAKTIDRLVQRGCIGKVTFPGHKRAAGFRYSDIARLIAAGGDGDGDDQQYCKAFADR